VTADGALLMMTMIVGPPFAGLIGAVVGFFALRSQPVSRRNLAIAFGIIVLPYVLSALVDPISGFDGAIEWGRRTLVSPIAFIALVGGTMMRLLPGRP
jgi:hypothetical protein